MFESVVIPATDPSWSLTANATHNNTSEHPVTHQSEMMGKRKLWLLLNGGANTETVAKCNRVSSPQARRVGWPVTPAAGELRRSFGSGLAGLQSECRVGVQLGGRVFV